MRLGFLTSAALAAAVLGGGCGAPPDEPPPPPPPMQLALGGAALDGTGFVALAGDVTLIEGAQGGFHVWTKYRVTGGPTGSVHVAYTIRRVSDQHLILTAQRQQDIGAPGDAGYWELPNAMPAFMCPSPLGVPIQDLPMRFELQISESEGSPVLGSAQTDFTPHCPEGGEADFCASICNG